MLDLSFDPSTLNEGVTQSELSLLDECPTKWNLRYNKKLKKKDFFDWSFYVGTAWHEFQERWRKEKGNFDLTKCTPPEIPSNVARDSSFEEDLDYWTYVLPAYQQAYAHLYKDEINHPWFIIEQELKYNFLDIELRGKIDLASDKPRFIRDFKSTSSAWLITPTGWHFKFQFMLYCWLMVKNHPTWSKKQFDFQMDIMQKPALRQTKGETFVQHIRRVCQDIVARPEFYLRRSTYPILPEQIEHFEKNILTPKIQKYLLASKPEGISIITDHNTNACNNFGKTCEFFEVCEKGWEAGQFFFERRHAKHVELV